MILQPETGNGHDEIGKLRLEAKADVNAPAGESRERTALQGSVSLPLRLL